MQIHEFHHLDGVKFPGLIHFSSNIACRLRTAPRI